MYKQKEKKLRKIILCIAPLELVKENLHKEVFRQILSNISKFKAYKIEGCACGKLSDGQAAYCIELNDPKCENRVVEIVEKLNFKIIS